ncbi:MAG: ATP-binding protein [Acidimicrobiales bacterium]
MPLTIDLVLPTLHSYVRTTRRAVAGWLEDAGLPAPLRDDLVMAIAEACNNVVQHAFPEGRGTFRLALQLQPGEVVVDVSDDGVGFEPIAQSVAPRGRLAGGGRGIEIMRRLVSAVEVESPTGQGGTRIRLRQTLPPERLSPAQGWGSRPAALR